jgi:hypothetical protein
MWQSVVNASFHTLDRFFSFESKVVTEGDLNMIKALGPPHKDNDRYRQMVRLLFYPGRHDMMRRSRRFPVESMWFDDGDFYRKFVMIYRSPVLCRVS